MVAVMLHSRKMSAYKPWITNCPKLLQPVYKLGFKYFSCIIFDLGITWCILKLKNIYRFPIWMLYLINLTHRLQQQKFGMDKQFLPTLYNGRNYLSILGLKLDHVSKSGWHGFKGCISKSTQTPRRHLFCEDVRNPDFINAMFFVWLSFTINDWCLYVHRHPYHEDRAYVLCLSASVLSWNI